MNRAQQQQMMTPTRSNTRTQGKPSTQGKPKRQKSRKPMGKTDPPSGNKNVINMPELKGTDMKNIIAYEDFKRNPPYLSLDEITGKKIIDDEGRLTSETAQSIGLHNLMGKKGGGRIKYGHGGRGIGITKKGVKPCKMR